MRKERKLYIHIASFDGTTWEVLGKDNEDLSKALNPDTETSKNVLGDSTFTHSGYQPEVSVDPYYADADSVLYADLRDIAIQEKFSDSDIKGYFVECMFDNAAVNGVLSGTGYKRSAYIVPQSIGGDTKAVGIPFTVTPVGPMTPVSVSYTLSSHAVVIAAVSG